MCSSEELEFPHILLDYQHGFLVSKTIFAACELGVFDLLHEVQEPISAATIASRLSTSEGGMESLLDACVGLKLLKVDLRNNTGYYSNTDVSTMYLVKSSPKTLHYMMIYFSKITYRCWHFLPQAVREGKCQYERALGTSTKDIFEVVYRSEEEMKNFMHFMDSTWNICGKYVVQAFDLSEFHTVYDLGAPMFAGLKGEVPGSWSPTDQKVTVYPSEYTISFCNGKTPFRVCSQGGNATADMLFLPDFAGCTGSLAKQFVSTYKKSTVTIMDLPKVVQATKKHFLTDKEQQIHFLEGDFFNDPIPEADLFIVARIIHDWTEEKCLTLLTKMYQACKPGGGVLIVELLLNEDKSGPVIAQMYSLYMLVQAEGKERTPSEYTKLLTASGFKDIEVKVTGKMYDAILGRK